MAKKKRYKRYSPEFKREAAIQSRQKPLKRSAANSVYLTVCVMFL